MKQINNGFMYYYYLTEDGQVYNAKSARYLTPHDGRYKLRTVSGKTQGITRSKLTMDLYGYSIIEDAVARLPGEEFVFIPGTQERYAISNLGRVISYTGQRVHLLKPAKNTANGYYRVSIKIDDKLQAKLVHQLVAAAFCPLPEGYIRDQLQIHHRDFDKENNASSNLEYLTPDEHMKKHIEHARQEENEV